MTDTADPRAVTVVVPMHNSSAYLAETLEAIGAQTRPAAEVLIVDDRSTDGSADLARRVLPSVRIERADFGHPERSRGYGVQSASHDLIAFCDADDVWLPHKLERQLDAVADLDPAGPLLCWTKLDEFVSPELSPDQYQGREPFLDHGARLVSSLLTTRSTCTSSSPTLQESGSWVEWVSGLAPDVPSVVVDEVLMRRRLHLTNHSAVTRSSDQIQAWLRAARQAAAQRREDETR